MMDQIWIGLTTHVFLKEGEGKESPPFFLGGGGIVRLGHMLAPDRLLDRSMLYFETGL